MTESSHYMRRQRLRRRQRELYIILAIVSLIAILTYIESHIAIISENIPVQTNIFVFGLININIILLVVLIFLILRNAAKLFFESKRKLMGSKLRTKLVGAFVGFTIVPTLLLFFVVIGFINKSIDSWFDIKVEDSLKESIELARNYYKDTSRRMLAGARLVAKTIATDGLYKDDERLTKFLYSTVENQDIAAVEVYSADGRMLGYGIAESVNQNMVPPVDENTLQDVIKNGAKTVIQTINTGDVVRGIVPLMVDGRVAGAVAISYYIPQSLVMKMKEITSAFENYKQLKILRYPIKTSYFVILLVITLIIVFFSIWIGGYIAREITVPIFELAEGTHAVASGNLNYRIEVASNDEIGLLVKSFNRMTEDLRAGKTRLEEANLSLRRINAELDRRRRYIEIVLSNIPAGVLSIDKDGRITSLNKVAKELLGLEGQSVNGRHYNTVLREEEREVFDKMLAELREKGLESTERQLKVALKDRVITVLLNLNVLRDEDGNYLGVVAVLDDLTDLLKTQRMLAWKEVAKRIAHEIKNPLTPIKLSAQRLRRKYMDRFPPEDKTFDECTRTIIQQTEELKALVNEFSSFARMPSVNPAPNDLNGIVEETVSLYRSGHRNINFRTETDPTLPVIDIDREKIKRVLINLIDNAIDSMEEGGTISVETHYDSTLGIARLEVSDTGCGIPAENKARLFEPYFSTKKTGTGLGLAIVNEIITDHNGYIRVKDNHPRGTRFVIELPVKVGAV
ncbi:MAG TPA: PAS domain S-box protein [Deltaproteobacteria bacterium]|nr:PAS domain S-box protein [Deltaproteobacteria bacterium]